MSGLSIAWDLHLTATHWHRFLSSKALLCVRKTKILPQLSATFQDVSSVYRTRSAPDSLFSYINVSSLDSKLCMRKSKISPLLSETCLTISLYLHVIATYLHQFLSTQAQLCISKNKILSDYRIRTAPDIYALTGINHVKLNYVCLKTQTNKSECLFYRGWKCRLTYKCKHLPCLPFYIHY